MTKRIMNYRERNSRASVTHHRTAVTISLKARWGTKPKATIADYDREQDRLERIEKAKERRH